MVSSVETQAPEPCPQNTIPNISAMVAIGSNESKNKTSDVEGKFHPRKVLLF